MAVALRLRGPLDADALGQALSDVVGRHESLRTLFAAPDGIPRQAVIARRAGRLRLAGHRCHRLVGGPAASRPSRRGASQLRPGIRDPFAGTAFPCRRRRACAGGRGAPHRRRRRGRSRRWWRDLGVAYASRVRGAAPGLGPSAGAVRRLHAVAARRSSATSTTPTAGSPAQLAYWQDALAGMPERLQLPTDRPYPPVADHRGATRGRGLAGRAAAAGRSGGPRARHDQLHGDAGRAGGAAVQVSASTDVAVGFPIAGRRDPALDELVGLLRQHLGAAGRSGRRSQCCRGARPRCERAAWPPTSTRMCPSRCSWSGSTPPAVADPSPAGAGDVGLAELRRTSDSGRRRADAG